MSGLAVISHREIVALQALTVAACSLGVTGKRDTAFFVNHGAAAYDSGQLSGKHLAMFLACAGCRLYAPFFATFRRAVADAVSAADGAGLVRCMLDCGKMLPEVYDNAELSSAQVTAVDGILQQEFGARVAFVAHLERYHDLVHLKKDACYLSICAACSSGAYLSSEDPVRGAMLLACGTPSSVRVPDFEPATGTVHFYRFDYVKLVQLLADGAPNPNTGEPFALAADLRALYCTQISMARYSRA